MTQALETLLPCPWCQNPGVEVAHTDFYWAVCQDDDCQAEGPVRRTEAEAITAWNTRKPCDAGLVERVRDAMISTLVLTKADLAIEDVEKLAEAAIASIHDQGVAE